MSSRTFSWLLVLTVIVAAILMLGVLVAMYIAAGGTGEPRGLGRMID